MSRDIAELGIRIDARQVQQGGTALERFAQSGARAETSANSAQTAIAKLGKGLAALATITAAIDFGQKIITAQREFDKLNSSLITATGSVANAGAAFKALQQFAATTPYGLQDVTKAFIQLRNLGLTPSERSLTSYGNTAAAMGKGLNQLIEAVADASTGEFERLKEFGIKSKQQGDTVAMTFQGVTTSVANNSAAIEAYLIALGETKFAGGMALQASTLDGAISNLADTWDMTLLTFSQSGFGDAALAATLTLTGALTDLQAIIRAVAGEADNEKKKIQELGPVHAALTTIFETVAVMGANVSYVLKAIGSDLGAFAAMVVAAAQGDFQLAMQIAGERKRDSAAERAEIDARTAKILGASTAARQVREQEAEAEKTNHVDRLARFAVQAQAQDTQSKAQKKAADEAQTWAKRTADAGALELAMMRAEQAAVGGLTDAQKNSLKVRAEMARFGDLIPAKLKNVINSHLNEAEALERVNLERAHYIALMGEAANAAGSDIKTANDTTKSLEDQVKYYGLNEVAVLRLKAAEYERQMAAADGNAIEVNRLFQLQAATEDQIVLQEKLSTMKAETTFWQSLEDTAHQTFISIADGGKGAAQRLKDTFKNIFFDWLYQQTLKKWVIQLSPTTAGGQGGLSSMLGALGNAYTSGSAEAGGGFMGGASGLINAGKMIYQGFTGGMAATMGGYITQFGNLFGSTAISSFGAGMAGTAGAASAGGAAASGAASAGASAASAIPIIGWIIAGMTANNKYFKEGWDIGGQTSDIAKSLLGSSLKGNPFGGLGAVATVGINAANNLLGKLGLNDQMASLLSGSSLWARAFGHRKASIEEQGITGTVSASGFDGDAYANILQKGGWFRSDKRRTQTADLSAQQDKSFDETIAAMIGAVKGFGSVLGLEATAIDGYSKQIKLVLTSDEAKNQEAIAALFGGIGDELSTLLLPSIAQFTAEGETASTTLQRLAADFASVSTIMQALGIDASKAFGAVGVASITARERLIALAGGVDALAAQTDFFAQNFLTKAEQIAPVQKAVNEQLAALGRAGITTSDQFKAAVLDLATSGALATEAGAKTYAGLLALAPAFKTVADYLKETGDQAASTAAAMAQALKDNEATLLGFVNSAMDAVKVAVSAQKDAVQAAYERNLAALEMRIDGISTSIERLSQLSGVLSGGLNSMNIQGQEAASRAAAQAQIEAALAIARAGGALPTADAIRQAVATASNTSTEGFATFLDYQRDFVRTSSALTELAGLADGQMTDAQRQLAVLQGQRDDLKSAADRELAHLDAILASSQMQVDGLNGVASGVMSLSAALATLAASIAGLKAGATPSNPGGTGLTVEGLYQSVLGRAGEASGLAFWKSAFGDSIDQNEMADFIKAAAPELAGRVPGFAGGGSHAGGWRVVGERGPELENTGPSRIYSNGASSDLFGGIEARLQSLETVMATGLSRLIGEAKRGADGIENIDSKGVATRDESEIA